MNEGRVLGNKTRLDWGLSTMNWRLRFALSFVAVLLPLLCQFFNVLRKYISQHIALSKPLFFCLFGSVQMLFNSCHDKLISPVYMLGYYWVRCPGYVGNLRKVCRS